MISGQTDDQKLARRLLEAADHEEIRQVVYRYCRGIDRRQFQLVRDCYHPEGTDDHGDYRGGIDGFIEYVTKGLSIWQTTTHFIGNVGIEVLGDKARVESYGVATHRRAATGTRPALDFVAGIRYVDDFERRDEKWLIATRVCLIDWTRTDNVEAKGWTRPGDYTQPSADEHDPVFVADLRELQVEA
jgi:SnoaL-like domain